MKKSLYFVFLLIAIILVLGGITHLYIQSNTMYRPRKIIVQDLIEGKEKALKPEEFGVSSFELNKYLIKLKGKSIYDKNYIEEFTKVNIKCLDELGIIKKALKKGYITLRIQDAANPIISYLIISFGILIFVSIIILNKFKKM